MKSGRARRFVREHVETGPDAAVANRRRQCRVIDHFAPRRVDEHRARLEPAEQLSIDQAVRPGPERQMDAEDVGLRRHVARGRRESNVDLPYCVFDTEIPRFVLGQRPTFPVEPPAPHHHVQPEARGAPNHRLRDAAGAEQAERLAEEALRA